jgi:hypothetical protein
MYPYDEQFGSEGFSRQGDLSNDEPSHGGDTINYAPSIKPIGANQSREDRIAALLPKLPPSLLNLIPGANPNNGIVVAQDSTAHERDANFARYGTGLPTQEDFQRAARRDALFTKLGLPQEITDSYAGHKQALAEADKYLAVAGHLHSMRNEISSKLDSADFLKDYSNLDHTDSNFEANTAKLLAKYPMAGGSAVQDAVQAKHSARANYLQGVAPGGADEFGTDTPERTAYINRLAQTKDPRAARAHAQNVQKGEEMIRTAVSKGLLDPNTDFPEWDGNDKTRPKIYNADGTVNYHEASLLAATRAPDAPGGVNDKSQKQESAQIRTYRDTIASAAKNPAMLDDPTFKALHAIATQKVLDYETNQAHESGAKPKNTATYLKY